MFNSEKEMFKKKKGKKPTNNPTKKKNLSGNKGTKALSSQHLSSLLYRLWKSVF